MTQSLVIVESPAKAKTINRYLGDGFIVKSSVGHVRDLGSVETSNKGKRARNAEEKRRKLFDRMGVNPEKDWKAHYEVVSGKEKVVAELKKLVKKSDKVYLATDLDREGEAIAWHLATLLGQKEAEKANGRFRRVIFNEISKSAVQKAFANPGEIDLNRVNAQQARRFLDRVVGFMLSPLLWDRVARSLSAGRVQSVAVRLLVEREREISAFVPKEYWEIDAHMKTAAGEAVTLQVKKKDGKAIALGSRKETDAALAELRGAEYKVSAVEEKAGKTRPYPPLITSTLQQAASARLGFGVKKTMVLAQRLYEAGHITYMRTDSTNLSKDALAAARKYIGKEFGDKYLPNAPIAYASKKSAQEAHEAIRPVNVDALPTGADADGRRLYELIKGHFVASQMKPAEHLSVSLQVAAGAYELRASGRVQTFDGHYRALPPVSDKRKKEVVQLPKLSKGDVLALKSLAESQHFTKPAPRYSEATLVRELEKRGIGRPSTYASIISTIQERGYVTLRKKRFYAEKIGEIVTDRLMSSFTDLMDYNFTAGMEEVLDKIAEGKEEWRTPLNRFYEDFVRKLDAAEGEGGMRENTPIATEVPCGKCERRKMVIRTGATGMFLGCSGYNDPDVPVKERCKYTIDLKPEEWERDEEEGDTEEGNESEARRLMDLVRCGKCGRSMEPYVLDRKHRLHICAGHPQCQGNQLEEGQFQVPDQGEVVLNCEKCGAGMEARSGRFGKYFACQNEECKNTRNMLKNGQPAPPKMPPVPMPELACVKVKDYYLLREGAAGLFLAASKFPKHRETRAPTVSELLAHKDEIDKKYGFLFKGPVADGEGNPTQVRFSRKNKAHYLATYKKDGKPTGWQAHYKGGLWVEEKAKSRSRTGGKAGKRSAKTAAQSSAKS